MLVSANYSRNPSHVICFEDFTIVKVIGRGSFGKVYLVRKNDSGSYYAMKVLKKDMIIKRNQKNNARGKGLLVTLAERHILEEIDHPFLVKLYYAF